MVLGFLFENRVRKLFTLFRFQAAIAIPIFGSGRSNLSIEKSQGHKVQISILTSSFFASVENFLR